jgi:hypothetical protein
MDTGLWDELALGEENIRGRPMRCRQAVPGAHWTMSACLDGVMSHTLASYLQCQGGAFSLPFGYSPRLFTAFRP